MSTPELTDAAARQLIVTALDQTLIVEAAAGTGKTTELVNRMIRVIGAGLAEMQSLVAVTFTEKAAGELRLRLRQRLEEERQLATGVEGERFARAVQSLEEAHVSTIHGFCADLLRERPIEARVDPMFHVLTEGQSSQLLSEEFDAWLRRHLEHPPEGVRRSLRRVSRWSGASEADGPVERLRRAALELNQWRDLRTPWTRESFDRVTAIRDLVSELNRLAALTANPTSARDTLYADTAPVRVLCRELEERATDALGDDLDGLEGRLCELARHPAWVHARKGSGAGYGPGVRRLDVLAARDQLRLALDDFRRRADADLAAALQQELLECLDAFAARRQARGALDFLDLLVRARDLVRDDPNVRRHFQGRFDRIFVDEFQDTDPLQAELLLLLASRDPGESDWQRVDPVPGKLFVVGDPKQSIYRFRRADLAVYRRVCDQLAAGGALRVELRRSFRSAGPLQRFVNAAFTDVMNGAADRQQARYVPLEGGREMTVAQPAVVALPVPRPYGMRRVSQRAIEASLPDAVGAYVHWLLTSSGWTVTERRGATTARVAVEARHVCILFRRFLSYGQDVARPYVDALEARGVPHRLVGGRAFHAREEIDTLRVALMAIEWPDDHVSVFSTLRGALFAIGDEELLEYHARGGRFRPFSRAFELPGRLAPVREALDFLAALHAQRNRRPIADTIGMLLTHTRAHVGFVLRPNGEQVLANVLHVAELARQYEQGGGMSFRGFVESLQTESAYAPSVEAPILEEASQGVRVMTVHKAKGLEFPVVVLADITARLAPTDVGRAVDMSHGLCALRLAGWAPMELVERESTERALEQAEGERLAYVAATRARDLLVVPGVGDVPWDGGWVSPLSAAIYPPLATRRAPRAAAGCPVFTSQDTVLERPDGDPAQASTVAPGEHDFGDGDHGYSVVWWSPEPRVLMLGAPVLSGLRRDDLVVKHVPEATIQDYLADYQQWQRARADAVRLGAVPEFEVRTMTDVARDEAVSIDGAVVDVERLEIDATRPRGPRFGSLVHAVLGDTRLASAQGRTDEVLADIDALARAHGRLLGASAAEVVSAGAAVRRALQHPLLLLAAEAEERGACYREMPVTRRLASGLLLEGTVDLAFENQGTIIVLDFKTDHDLEASLGIYRRQVQLYAVAIGEALGKPTRGVIVGV